MKKQHKILLLIVTIFGLLSCKKKYDADLIGPVGKEELNPKIVSVFTASADTANFGINPFIPFFFKGAFDKKITWKITIKGLTSGAEKTLIGTSSVLDSLNAIWNGAQDSLYYFVQGEKCLVTLTDFYPQTTNNFYNDLNNKGTVMPPSSKITVVDTIKITKTKILQDNAFELFDYKQVNTSTTYSVDYDPNQTCYPSLVRNSECTTELGGSTSNVVTVINSPLPLARRGLPISQKTKNTPRERDSATVKYSDAYFILKGTDITKDYYIGRMERTLETSFESKALKFLKSNTISPSDLWFNVFVYGIADGSRLNYTIKEDDTGDGKFTTMPPCVDYVGDYPGKGTGDDAYEKSIVVDFLGWKLYSFRYSDFDVVADGKNGNGNKIRNPEKIWSVQFSLVASKPGGSAQVIFDYPVMTVGGPLKY